MRNTEVLPRHSRIKLGNPKFNCGCNWQWMQKATKLSKGTLTTEETEESLSPLVNR